MKTYRYCIECGAPVYKREAWATRCSDCYFAKTANTVSSRSLDAELRSAKHKISCLTLENIELRAMLASTPKCTDIAIPDDIRRMLRSLCHPDRHHGTPRENSATRVMQWLNGATQ